MNIITMNREKKNTVKIAVITIIVAALFFAMVPAQSFAYSPSKANNSTMVGFLPTEGVSVSMPLQSGITSFVDKNGNYTGHQTYENINFINAKASTKSGMKQKVAELTAGKSSDYDKAAAIQAFVKDHMTYYGHFISIDGAWERGIGNCMTYAELTSALLYYAGIPNAYAITNAHTYNLVLCEGRWIPSDSQTYFDGNLNSDFKAISLIIFRNGKLTYAIDDLSGIKLTDIGKEYGVVDSAVAKSGITIPSYVTGCYKKWMEFYPDITIRGTRGTAAESLATSSGYKCISYSGNQFTANRSHENVKTTVKAATYFDNGKAINRCKHCAKATADSVISKKKLAKPSVSFKGGKKKVIVKYTHKKGATGFQVAYKKAGSKKFKTRNYNSRSKASKTIKKLKRGKYTIKVRAYVKSGNRCVYSTWTPAKSVRVK